MGSRIRPAVPDDHAAFARLFPELGVDDAIPDATRFATEMVPTTIIMEDANGSAVGYAYWVVLKETVHLSQIVTAKEARRTGIGRAVMSVVREKARATGRPFLTLNVNPRNEPAVRLYESFGMERIYASKALRLDWKIVDALPEADTALASFARNIEPHEDERIEKEAGIISGYLTDARSKAGRVLRVIDKDGAILAAAVFDTGFPGAYPFRASSEVAALSMLRALRPHAKPSDEIVNIAIMDQPETANVIVARGATVRLETVHMRVALT